MASESRVAVGWGIPSQSFSEALRGAIEGLNEWAATLAKVTATPKFSYMEDDKTAAVRAFMEHGGKPNEIFSIERAYLGELVDYEECLFEAEMEDLWVDGEPPSQVNYQTDDLI